MSAHDDSIGPEPVKVRGIAFAEGPKRKGVYWTFMLLGAPTSFLLMESARYGFRQFACDNGAARIALEVSGGLAVAIPAMIALLSWRDWKADGVEWPNDAPDAASRDRFLAVMCFTLALLCVAWAIALWAPSLFLSPCQSQ